jgi:hypothetical protein
MFRLGPTPPVSATRARQVGATATESPWEGWERERTRYWERERARTWMSLLASRSVRRVERRAAWRRLRAGDTSYFSHRPRRSAIQPTSEVDPLRSGVSGGLACMRHTKPLPLLLKKIHG